MTTGKSIYWSYLFIVVCWSTPAARGAVLFSENFDSLPLGPNVEESLAGAQVWTSVGPAGWSIDRTGVPGYNNPSNNNGVKEWIGWNFADRNWWVQAAGDQRRSEFTRANGAVMIADPDEWDDQPHPATVSNGGYDTYISSPAIAVSSVAGGQVTLTFDSSWQPEWDSDYHQSANLRASFDGGAPLELFRWLSDPTSANFKPGATNESLGMPINVPVGANNMVLTWGLFDAGNDWWWAVDNISVVSGTLSGDPVLKVYTNTGKMVLDGGTLNYDIAGLQISSIAGSLDPTYWAATNLQAQQVDAVTDPSGATPGPGNDPGESWETLVASSYQIWDGFLLGSSEFYAGRSETLGYGYRTSLNVQDLVFRFATTNGQLITGNVSYAVQPPEPDQTADGLVNIFDVNAVSAAWGATGYPGIPGDANLDGAVNIFDLNLISAAWGPVGGGMAVPEPATYITILASMLGLAIWAFVRQFFTLTDARKQRFACSRVYRY